jgi:hypothetical protein
VNCFGAFTVSPSRTAPHPPHVVVSVMFEWSSNGHHHAIAVSRSIGRLVLDFLG